MKVVSVAYHDSASAVAAIPGFGKNKLYVCLGTNANMGVETDRPDISDAAYRYGFKNSLQGEPGAFLVYQDFPAFLLVNAVKRNGRSKETPILTIRWSKWRRKPVPSIPMST